MAVGLTIASLELQHREKNGAQGREKDFAFHHSEEEIHCDGCLCGLNCLCVL